MNTDKLHLLEPAPYIEFLALQRRATAVITDSGGIQEETTYLQVPCLTLRSNTERPITVTMGTNTLVGQDSRKLASELSAILEGKGKRGVVPLFGTGTPPSVSLICCSASEVTLTFSLAWNLFELVGAQSALRGHLQVWKRIHLHIPVAFAT